MKSKALATNARRPNAALGERVVAGSVWSCAGSALSQGAADETLGFCARPGRDDTARGRSRIPLIVRWVQFL